MFNNKRACYFNLISNVTVVNIFITMFTFTSV